MQHSKSLTILFALLLGSAYGAGIALPSNARELAAPNSELDDAVVTRGLGGKSLAEHVDMLAKRGRDWDEVVDEATAKFIIVICDLQGNWVREERKKQNNDMLTFPTQKSENYAAIVKEFYAKAAEMVPDGKRARSNLLDAQHNHFRLPPKTAITLARERVKPDDSSESDKEDKKGEEEKWDPEWARKWDQIMAEVDAMLAEVNSPITYT